MAQPEMMALNPKSCPKPSPKRCPLTCTPTRCIAPAERRLSSGLLRSAPAPEPMPPAAATPLLIGLALMPTLGSETAGSAGNAPYSACPTLGGGPCAIARAWFAPGSWKPPGAGELKSPGDEAKLKPPAAGAEAGKVEVVMLPNKPGLEAAAELKENDATAR